MFLDDVTLVACSGGATATVHRHNDAGIPPPVHRPARLPPSPVWTQTPTTGPIIATSTFTPYYITPTPGSIVATPTSTPYYVTPTPRYYIDADAVVLDADARQRHADAVVLDANSVADHAHSSASSGHTVAE